MVIVVLRGLGICCDRGIDGVANMVGGLTQGLIAEVRSVGGF